MEKLSQDDLIKIAHLAGRVNAFSQLGYTDDQIKVAFVQSGYPEKLADVMIKESFLGALANVGKGIVGAGRALSHGGAGMLAKGTAAAGKIAPGAGRMATMMPKAQQFAGKTMQGAGRGLSRSGIAFTRNPAKALGSGALNLGQGAMLGSGKGVGGTIGKGIFGANMASMLMPGGQSPQIPQPYGQYGSNPYGG